MGTYQICFQDDKNTVFGRLYIHGFFFLTKSFFRKKKQWCLCHFNLDWCTFVYHSLHNYEPKIKVKSKEPTTRQHWANQDTPWNSVSSSYDEKDCFPFFNFGINSYTVR